MGFPILFPIILTQIFTHILLSKLTREEPNLFSLNVNVFLQDDKV